MPDECRTPGAIYSTSVDGPYVTVRVTLPRAIVEAEALAVERALHATLESALAPLFGGETR